MTSSHSLDEACPPRAVGVRGREDGAEEDAENKDQNVQDACGDNQPGDRQSEDDDQPGDSPSDGDDQPGDRQSEEDDDQPGDRQSEEDDQPGDGPGEGDTQPGDFPGEGDVQPEDRPGEGDVQPEDRPGEGDVQLEDRPGERDVQPEDKPGVKDADLQQSPSSRGGVAVPCPERDRERRADEHKGIGPFYFFGGTNGAPIVTLYCESRGWRRIYDKNREDFKLKWTETRSPMTYLHFKEGEQLLYQIPNNKVLTNKIGLLTSLREYERVSSKVNHGRGLRRLKMKDFFPSTFRLDLRDEREAFFAQQEGLSSEESGVWICKPTGLNQGKGIFLLKTQEEIASLKVKLQLGEETQSNQKMPFRLPQARIIQRYIQNPLLLKGRKFDVRSYFLIACTAPYMVFFRHGYVRLTCDLYDPNSNNLSAHLTNQYMQKKNPMYSVLKEETVWSMERFNTYVNEKLAVAKGLPRDWVLGTFAKRMQQIMTQCFFAVKSKLVCKLGFFDLIGCDFLIDEDFKVWLLEMNCNPALHTNCEVLKDVIPLTVVETLDIAIEIFNKCRCGLRILPLTSQKDFLLLFDGEPPVSPVAAPSKLRGASMGRIQRPLSATPRKRPAKKPAVKEEVITRLSCGRKTKGFPVTAAGSDTSVTTEGSVMSKEAGPSLSPSTAANDCLSTHPTPALAPSASLSKAPALPRSVDPSRPGAAKSHQRSRVELRMGKCTWHQRSRNLLPEVQCPPPATEPAHLCATRTQGSEVAHPRLGPPYCNMLGPSYLRMSRPQSGGNVSGERRGGRCSQRDPKTEDCGG